MAETGWTKGRTAYEADVAADPFYFGGTRRRSWRELDKDARQAWEARATDIRSPLILALEEVIKCKRIGVARELARTALALARGQEQERK